MSLNFDYSKVTKGWQSTTESVIYLTMAVGMPKITWGNAFRFAARVEMLKSGFRLVAEIGKEEINNTLEVIENHVGLTTNANTYTDAQFRKRALAIAANSWDFELSRWAKKFDLESENLNGKCFSKVDIIHVESGAAVVAAVEPVEADEAVDSDDEPQEDCECKRSTGRDDNGDCAYCGGANPPDRD